VLPLPDAGSPSDPRPSRTSGAWTVLLATDLERASLAATETALELAAGLHARLVVTNVVEPGAGAARGRLRVDQVRAGRESAVGAIVERARSAGIDATFLVWEGTAAHAIVDAAAAEGADVIVVGSRGLGAVGRFVLGSVSDHVVRHADCPVLIVRPTPQGRQARGFRAVRQVSPASSGPTF
jgi:nucleotide-binding universal stress UspA family protein